MLENQTCDLIIFYYDYKAKNTKYDTYILNVIFNLGYMNKYISYNLIYHTNTFWNCDIMYLYL